MSLIDEFKSTCAFIEKTRVPDGEGGFHTSWTTLKHCKKSWQLTLTFLASPCLLILFFTYDYVVHTIFVLL